MQLKKLFTLLAFVSVAAMASADDVTFTYDGGQNKGDWVGMETTPWDPESGDTFWRANPSDHTYLILKASNDTFIQGYTITLRSNNKTDGRLPYTWKLYGSNDDAENAEEKEWTLIHHQKQANDIVEKYKSITDYTYYCHSKTAYKYYKFNILAKAELGYGWGCFEISGIDLIPSSVGFSGSGNALDGETDSKLTGDVTQTIDITPTTPTTIKGYQFTTANDTQSYPGQNPKIWTLEGSPDGGSSWTTIDTKTDSRIMEGKNYYPYTFVLANESTTYNKYRFTVTGVQEGNSLQLSEVALITDLTNCTNGTYEIDSEEDLIAFAGFVNDGKNGSNAYLTDNIDMSDEESYTPIGSSETYSYAGTFNGQGHSIRLGIDTSDDYQGLFGHASGGATIKDLIIKGSIKCGGNSAALIGEARGGGIITINRVGCEATVNGGTNNNIGAFVGNDWGWSTTLKIEDSYNIGDISGSSWTAVVGNFLETSSTCTNVYNKGTISSNKFVNENRGSFTNCYTTTNGQGSTSGLTQGITDIIASGELCYRLNGSTCYDVNWTQTIGTDNHPLLDTTHGIVNYILDACFTTQYIPSTDVTIPTDVEAYAGVITGDGGWLHLASIDEKIQAGEPVILKGSTGYYSFVPTTGASPAASNVLKGSDGTIVGSGNGIYALAKKNSVVGFYPVGTAEDPVTIPAGKAYLDLDGAPTVKGFTFVFDDDATGLSDLSDKSDLSDQSEPIYNLSGQKLSKMQKGINIVNGRKVLF